MTKKLLFVFSFMLGISSLQATHKIEEEPQSLLYCDTNAPTGVQMSNITLTSGTVTWTADPNSPDNMIRYRIPEQLSGCRVHLYRVKTLSQLQVCNLVQRMKYR